MLLKIYVLTYILIIIRIKVSFEMKQQSEFLIIFYEKEDGTMPARDFILGLDKKLKAKTLRNINLLKKAGPALR